MTDTPATGLRDLPLYQYLVRGKRSDVAAHYEELQRLRQERVAALTPLHSGPFRLFIFKNQEEMLQKIAVGWWPASTRDWKLFGWSRLTEASVAKWLA